MPDTDRNKRLGKPHGEDIHTEEDAQTYHFLSVNAVANFDRILRWSNKQVNRVVSLFLPCAVFRFCLKTNRRTLILIN